MDQTKIETLAAALDALRDKVLHEVAELHARITKLEAQNEDRNVRLGLLTDGIRMDALRISQRVESLEDTRCEHVDGLAELSEGLDQIQRDLVSLKEGTEQ